MTIAAVAFLCAIAFQRDYGDGIADWFVYQALMVSKYWEKPGVPEWWPIHGRYSDLCLFFPWAAILLFLVLEGRSAKNGGNGGGNGDRQSNASD
jgi:hypothetical protein